MNHIRIPDWQSRGRRFEPGKKGNNITCYVTLNFGKNRWLSAAVDTALWSCEIGEKSTFCIAHH